MNIKNWVRKYYYQKIRGFDFQEYAARWIDKHLDLELKGHTESVKLDFPNYYVDLSKDIYDIYGVLYTPKLFDEMINSRIEQKNLLTTDLIQLHLNKYYGKKLKIPYTNMDNGQRYVKPDSIMLFSKSFSEDYRALVDLAFEYYEEIIEKEILHSGVYITSIDNIWNRFRPWQTYAGLDHESCDRVLVSAFDDVAISKDGRFFVDIDFDKYDFVFRAKPRRFVLDLKM